MGGLCFFTDVVTMFFRIGNYVVLFSSGSLHCFIVIDTQADKSPGLRVPLDYILQ